MMAGGVEDLRIQYSNLIYSPDFEGIIIINVVMLLFLYLFKI